jgi:uncharacterized protein
MFAYPTAGIVRAATIGLFLFASIAGAAAQKAPSASALATARELIAVKGANTLYEPLVGGVVEQAKNVFLKANPLLGKELNEVAAKLRADFAPRSAEVLTETAKLYATHFTEQELKDALAFYKSPLGQKLLAREPAVVDESMRSARMWADKLSEQVIAAMRAEMRKRGHEI